MTLLTLTLTFLLKNSFFRLCCCQKHSVSQTHLDFSYKNLHFQNITEMLILFCLNTYMYCTLHYMYIKGTHALSLWHQHHSLIL